jgi:hypothetical protein
MGARRGPKVRLSTVPMPAVGRVEAPVELSAGEQAEFNRLVERANRLGLLARNDPMALADLARAQCLLNRLYAGKAPDVAEIAKTQNIVRGLRRECGITVQPSRVMLRTSPGEAMDQRSYWREKMAGGE